VLMTPSSAKFSNTLRRRQTRNFNDSTQLLRSGGGGGRKNERRRGEEGYYQGEEEGKGGRLYLRVERIGEVERRTRQGEGYGQEKG
jgi:hypothetical protein